MTQLFSEDDVVVTVTRLTRSQLTQFIEDAFVKPERGPSGYLFRPIDIARPELLCDLSQDLDLDQTALGIVVSLLDQLHAARQDLAAMALAIERLPADVRARLGISLRQL